MVSLRFIAALLLQGLAIGCCCAQPAQLPDAPQPSTSLPTAEGSQPDYEAYSSSTDRSDPPELAFLSEFAQIEPNAQDAGQGGPHTPSSDSDAPRDAQGNPIPLERQQPRRILGLMPNFRSVSGGAKPPPPSWRYNFNVATHQATDYSTFIILGLTSLTAEATNAHPALGKGMGGFYAYTWRGFLDKSDGTYLSAWLLPSLLHEDTRFYALGDGHSITTRALYVLSRQAVARTYGGSQTPNIAGLGGKVLTQVISRYYYPPGATDFGTLATKFGYAVMRDVANSTIREFYPDIAAHYIRKHREREARRAAQTGALTPYSGFDSAVYRNVDAEGIFPEKMPLA